MPHTWLESKQDILRVLAKRDAAIAGLPIPMTSDLVGSSTVLNDSRLGFGTSQANKYDGRVIEIVELVTSPANGPTFGRQAAVDDAGFDLVDGLTLSPAMNEIIQTGTDYLIYPLGLSRELIEGAMHEVNRETQGPHLHRPSLIRNASLDGADSIANGLVTDDWTEVGTLSLGMHFAELGSTGAGDDRTEIFLGEQSIHGIAGEADAGWKCDPVPVTDTETLLVSVYVKALVGSVQVVLFNETTSANIKAVTIDEQVWTEVRFSEVIPAGCNSVSLRILGVQNTDDFLMSAHPVFQTVGAGGRPYPMPEWLKSEAQIMGWVKFPRGVASEDADSYIGMSRMTEAHPAVSILRDARAVNQLTLEMEPDGSVDPVGLIAQREFRTLTIAPTTVQTVLLKIDRAYMRSAAVSKILRDLGDPAASGWARAARVRGEQVGYGVRDLIIEPTPSAAL